MSSAGSRVAATATTLSATAVTIVPTSCPRREPGPSTAPAMVDSTLASVSDNRTASTATAVGAAPRLAARAMSAPNAIAMNTPAGSSRPTTSRERASRRRSSGSRLNTSGRSTASPASALCATRPPTQSKNTSASTSVAAAWFGYDTSPSQIVPRAERSTSPAPISSMAGLVLRQLVPEDGAAQRDQDANHDSPRAGAAPTSSANAASSVCPPRTADSVPVRRI